MTVQSGVRIEQNRLNWLLIILVEKQWEKLIKSVEEVECVL
jgi:hypothetical protein